MIQNHRFFRFNQNPRITAITAKIPTTIMAVVRLISVGGGINGGGRGVRVGLIVFVGRVVLVGGYVGEGVIETVGVSDVITVGDGVKVDVASAGVSAGI